MLKQDKRLAEQHSQMLAQNTELTREVARLTKEVHAAVYTKRGTPDVGA
jgi:hypothetical protein